VDGDFNCQIGDNEINGNPNNIVLEIVYESNSGLRKLIEITEQGLSDALVLGNNINIIDADGENAVLELYKTVPVNVTANW